MIKILIHAVLLTCITFHPLDGWSAGFPAEKRGHTDESVIHLFNSENLDGWYSFLKNRGRNTDPDQVFRVDNGKIVISGEEFGCLTSVNEYEDYRLVVEYQWGERTFLPRADKARDSGILLHSVGEDGGYQGIWKYSLECQLIEGGTGDLLVVGDGSDDFSLSSKVKAEKQKGSYQFDPNGEIVTIHGGRINWYGRDPDWKDIKGFRGTKDVEKPLGKWNKLECVVRDGDLSVWLNGKLVNQAFNVRPRKGQIQIQSEGAEIRFRRIDLIK